MRVARSFHVGFRPGSSIRSIPEPSALFSAVRSQRSARSIAARRARRAIASVRTAILMTEADSNSDVAVVLVGAPALEVPRRDADPALAPRRRRRHRGVDAATSGARRRSSRSRRAGRAAPSGGERARAVAIRLIRRTPSTLIALLDPRARGPASTLPGPISSARSTPCRASRCTDSTQRTGESIWRTSASRSAPPAVAAAASTLVTTGSARVGERRRRRAAASSARAPATSARSGTAPTPAAGSRAWPRARGTPRRRARRPRRARRSRSARASCSWPATTTSPCAASRQAASTSSGARPTIAAIAPDARRARPPA